jgi:hypothetical protein
MLFVKGINQFGNSKIMRRSGKIRIDTGQRKGNEGIKINIKEKHFIRMGEIQKL